jgi:hypothetical protein
MSAEALLDRLRALGVSPDAHADTWIGSADLFAALDAIARSGCVVLMKVDGLRTNGAVYTIVVSGGFLDDDHFRSDSADLATLAGAAIAFVAERLAARRRRTEHERWVDAGKTIGTDASALVPCPRCAAADLDVQDTAVYHGKFERQMRCPACGAQNFLLMRAPR